MSRFTAAFRAFWSIFGSAETAEAWATFRRGEKLAALPAPVPEPKPEPTSDISGDAVYTLVLLQREGRLIDFLFEDIDGYADAQIGAAVRQIHANCRDVLTKSFGVTAIRSEDEGAQAEVPVGFDPREIRVTGSPGGDPPFTGALRHHGWRITKVDFPERHAKLDPTIICPAEIEV